MHNLKATTVVVRRGFGTHCVLLRRVLWVRVLAICVVDACWVCLMQQVTFDYALSVRCGSRHFGSYVLIQDRWLGEQVLSTDVFLICSAAFGDSLASLEHYANTLISWGV